MPSRLKSLELNGYKTFANQTLFEFADTITTIVGPNGSGKSNIADSIRWVLGEQSYRLLRGKKTADMIFSGSQSRPRAGMASASITFNNADGWLPIDFSEVAITRRAYRDSANEYLINGKRVRLRDVSILLSQSGLSERTYTIIGQGLVDAALALRAEDRRRLFEEAAGLSLYRSRKEEAVRRLETTKRNIERVQDILSELKPHLSTLERQARRANEHAVLDSELRDLLKKWYGYHWNRKQLEWDKTSKLLSIREEEIEKIRLDLTSHERKSRRLSKEIESLKASKEVLSHEMAKLNSQRESILMQLAVSEERERSLQQQIENFEFESEIVQKDVVHQQEQLEFESNENNRLLEDHRQAKSRFEKIDQELSEYVSNRETIDNERSEVLKELEVKRVDREGLQENVNRFKAEYEVKNTLLQEATQHRESHENEIDNYKAAIADFETERDRISNEYGAVDLKLKNMLQKIDESEVSRGKLEEEQISLEAERIALDTQLDVLEQANATLTGFEEGARLLLKLAQKEKHSEKNSALVSLLNIPPEFEHAITAALGEFTNAVLVESDPVHSLNVLRDESLRGVILPMEKINLDQNVIQLQGNEESVIGVAVNLIKAPSRIRQVAELLLGQVIVVKDRKTAERVIRNQPPFAKAVTLSGEVFFASGPIISDGVNGVPNKNTKLDGLGYKNKLLKELIEKKKNINALEKEQTKSSSALAGLEREREELSSEHHNYQIDLQRISSELNNQEYSLSLTERQLHDIKNQINRLSEELSSNEINIIGSSDELTIRQQEVNTFLEQLTHIESQIIDQPDNEIQSQHSHWKTAAAVAEKAHSDALLRYKDRQEVLAKLIESKNGLEKRCQEQKTRLTLITSEKAKDSQSLNEVHTKLKDVSTRIKDLDIRNVKAESDYLSLQEEERTFRSMKSEAEHLFAQASIDQNKKAEILDSLRVRIEEDLEISLKKYAELERDDTKSVTTDTILNQLPQVKELPPELSDEIKRSRAKLNKVGAINPEAQDEYEGVKKRHSFLTEQLEDLAQAEIDVRKAINELDLIMEREFCKTFEAIEEEFGETFKQLFGGGSARLVLSDPDDITQTGIEIDARLPGRRTHGLSLLSGGERSLTATALIFSLIRVSPTPFCLLDEVDAMLDDANTARFREMVKEMSRDTQFVIVTHNRNTVQVADVIYGVTMGKDSTSQILSLKMDEVASIVD